MRTCGTLEVNAAPLLMLVGAAMAGHNGPEIETIIEMLGPGNDDADD